MKFLVLILSTMILSYTCSATSRRIALGGLHGQGNQYFFKQAQKVEENNSRKSNFKHPESGISNHHSLPREYFNNSQGNDNDNGNGGSG
ncbi:hypothetical protein E5676_scaffold432G00070 [Cucumis melo var. makuwa]|uniref:Uncharacterized protein n=2 Tax=Cucumis melo TaxID=3656 RepID=A0A5A7TVP9_CUCMM|nr:hypothetical protein E6C27_scaffold908G00330 [Cucumis melo var. makuwa]TYK05876.1 hypothetical protein E5676_scaffold432G00070 [Cucumis melo var. makuwa]